MAKFKFENFASSTLAAGIAAGDTTFNLAAGTGAKFPTLAAGEYFMLKVINSAKQAEIVKVTAHAASSDQLTVERAKEGTAARAFASGDAVQLILTRDLLAEFLTRNPPVAKSANYSTVVDDNGGFHELGAGVTQVTLGDAAVLRPTTADQWSLRLKNVSSANITIARATGTDTINRVTANITLYPGQEVTVDVNAARNGFEVTYTGFTTGDVKLTLKTVADTGWIMANDGTIGSASSGATTRAHADTEALYTLLWNNISDTYAPVSTGRGASAAADFAANKTIALTKMLGRALGIGGAGAGLTARSLGQTVGAETHTLTQDETPLKSHSHGITDPGHSHGRGEFTGQNMIGGSAGAHVRLNTNPMENTDSAVTGITVNATADDTATPHNNMQPTSFLNAMIKL